LANGAILLDPEGKIEFEDDDIVSTQAAATYTIENAVPDVHKLQLTYTVEGITWNSHYVLSLDESGQQGELTARATVNNLTDQNYLNARLAVFAGDVSRFSRAGTASEGGGDQATMVPGEVGENYVYRLPFRVDILARQIKQLHFTRSQKVGVSYEYEVHLGYDSWGDSTDGQPIRHWAWQWLVMNNSETNGLGIPLPKGVFQVQRADQSGEFHLIGENAVPDVRRGDNLRCPITRLRDIEIHERELSYGFQTGIAERFLDREAEVTLRNLRSHDVLIKVWVWPGPPTRFALTPVPDERGNRKAAYHIQLPAGGERTLRYRIMQFARE